MKQPLDEIRSVQPKLKAVSQIIIRALSRYDGILLLCGFGPSVKPCVMKLYFLGVKGTDCLAKQLPRLLRCFIVHPYALHALS